MASILVVLSLGDGAERYPMLLEQGGHQVARAEDGLQAYLACMREPPDVLVCGHLLPRLDGAALRTLLRLHDLPKQPGVLMLLRPGEADPGALEPTPGSQVLEVPREEARLLEAVDLLLRGWGGDGEVQPAAP